MRRTTTTGIFGAMLAVLAAGIAEARTVTVQTPSIVPDADGYVYCRVEARGPRPLEIVAKVVATAGADVTEFGTGFRASPAATGDGRYYAEETAGSMHDGARSCSATITGARRSDIDISLTAFDASGNALATVQGK
jgi:hypothetical protein